MNKSLILLNMDVFKRCTFLVLCFGTVGRINAAECSAVDELRQEMQAEIRALKEEIERVKEDRVEDTKRFVMANPFAEKPAFSAALGAHSMSLGNYQTIVFDQAFTNDMGAYSPVTGVFTVPINGTYFFTATVMSHSGQYLETEICLNGQTLVLMFSKDSSFEQGTNSVVLALTVGDRVWVRHHGTEGSNAYGGSWSAFSGFLI